MSTPTSKKPIPHLEIPPRSKCLELEVEERVVKLTNLAKPFWPELGITKDDLLQYYADVAPLLLPHLKAHGAGALKLLK